MKKIESAFNKTFAHWEIRLPPDAVAQRKPGQIVQAGWAIWYLFGSDEKGEYLDYYASHRMTNDCHVRLYASGEREALPAVRDFRLCSDDPEENARLKAEYLAHNRQVHRILEEKGFGFTGAEPGSVPINRLLRMGQHDG